MDQNPQQPPQEDLLQPSDFSMEGYDKHIKNARNTLFVLAGLTLILNLWVLLPIDGDLAKMISLCIIAGVCGLFLGLAFWTKKRPYTAILIALIVYSVLIILGWILEPTSIIKGILFKIAIIVLLVRGLRNAKESQDMLEAFGKKR